MSDRTPPLRSHLNPAEKADILIRWEIRDTRKSLAQEYHCRTSLIDSIVNDRNARRRAKENKKSMSTPLFIPLKTEHYENFRNGSKTEEFRPYGPGWNERTCGIGRRATISKGYGRQHRMHGTIVGFRLVENPSTLPGWTDCYGNRKTTACAIKIELDPVPCTPQ